MVDLEETKASINTGWLLNMAFNIIVMQSGFALLEIGSSPTGSAVAVGMKNVVDMATTAVGFFLVGYGLAFGDQAGPTTDHGTSVLNGAGLVGTTGFALSGVKDGDLARFVLQFAFASTSVTIVSGAVIGRIRFMHYMLLALVESTVAYPVPVHAA